MTTLTAPTLELLHQQNESMKKDFKGNIIRERGKGSMVVRIKGEVRGPCDPGEIKVNVRFTPETNMCAIMDKEEKIKISSGKTVDNIRVQWDGEDEEGHLRGVPLQAEIGKEYEAKMHLGKWKKIPNDESMVKTRDPAKITYVDIVAELSEDSAERLGDWKVGLLKIGEC